MTIPKERREKWEELFTLIVYDKKMAEASHRDRLEVVSLFLELEELLTRLYAS